VLGVKPDGNRRQHRHHELLYALESARSRLAVAIAAESKVTPRERWRRYLETEDRMRRCLRAIRCQPARGSRRHGWGQALSLLRQPLPVVDRTNCGEAHRLCEHLSEVLSLIENHGRE